MKIHINLEIVGRQVRLRLEDGRDRSTVAEAKWDDERDLSQQFFRKLESLFRKSNLAMRDVEKMEFSCDSPYFARKTKWQEMKLEDLDGTGKCGFTAWQTGEIISTAVNFALEK